MADQLPSFLLPPSPFSPLSLSLSLCLLVVLTYRKEVFWPSDCALMVTASRLLIMCWKSIVPSNTRPLPYLRPSEQTVWVSQPEVVKRTLTTNSNAGLAVFE